jgi:hypothetical protein
MVKATIGDLAITSRFSRESDEVRRRGCIEHDFAQGLKIRAIRGTEAWVAERELTSGVLEAPRRAEKEWRLKSTQEQNHSQKV